METIIDENESRSIQRQNEQVPRNLNEGPFSNKNGDDSWRSSTREENAEGKLSFTRWVHSEPSG